jgi:hypothetical protein
VPGDLKITDRGTLLEGARATAGHGKRRRRSQRAARNIICCRRFLPVMRCVIGVATNISNISNTSSTCRSAETDCEPARERVYFLA